MRLEEHQPQQTQSEGAEEDSQRLGRSLRRLHGKVRLCQARQGAHAETRARIGQKRRVVNPRGLSERARRRKIKRVRDSREMYRDSARVRDIYVQYRNY